MKNKRMDEIVSAAFGELDADLGKMTETERAEFEKLRAIKHGLNALREVPECQLSNERLSSAILGSAVKPRRAGGWGIASAGIAALALFALFVQTRFPAQRQDATALNRTADGSVGAPIVQPDANNGSSKQSPIVSGNGGDQRVAKNDPGSDRTMATALDKRDFQPQDFKEFVPVSFTPNEETGLENAVYAPDRAQEKSPIVVVDGSSKTRNGAAKATEVSAYGDVVFGG